MGDAFEGADLYGAYGEFVTCESWEEYLQKAFDSCWDNNQGLEGNLAVFCPHEVVAFRSVPPDGEWLAAQAEGFLDQFTETYAEAFGTNNDGVVLQEWNRGPARGVLVEALGCIVGKMEVYPVEEVARRVFSEDEVQEIVGDL